MNRRRRWNGKVFRMNARSVRFIPACERLEDIQLLSSILVGTDDFYTLYGNSDGSDLTTYDYRLAQARKRKVRTRLRVCPKDCLNSPPPLSLAM